MIATIHQMESDTDRTYCGVGIRGVAMFVDSFIWIFLTFIAMPFVGILTGNIETGNGTYADLEGTVAVLGLSLWFVLAISYHTVFEWKYGQTLGKYLVSIKVEHKNGGTLSLRESFLRNLLRLVDWLPIFYIVGIGVLFVSNRYQRIGDRVAGTVIVRT